MELQLGINPKPDGSCTFLVWAPFASEVEVVLSGSEEKAVRLERGPSGYFSGNVPACGNGTRYFFRLDQGGLLPDPASRFQPKGVHGPSEVVHTEFEWTDPYWGGVPLRDFIIYELHVGTFSADGTFDGVIAHLPELKALGVTVIEIMPVAQFPGKRNWGYDGVGMYAVQESYGGPSGLKRLVNSAHSLGLAVVLDVVYNHLGPEGNYLDKFGPYFNKTYSTPWGAALNFDGRHSDHVRRFFIENALYWQSEFHIDGLRLDAVHAIRDFSAVPFLVELKRETAARAVELKRPFHLIAESDLNATRIILPERLQGYGLDAQWADDFHHCLHVLLTGETCGYYEDYVGGLDQFAKVWRNGFAYLGEYSTYRKMRHGSSTQSTSFKQFVVCTQNHDQVGNRMKGDRLSNLLDLESLKLAAGCVLLSPFIPLLFMGEEYGETAPFQYFVDHGDDDLLKAVRRGRTEEFAAFEWQGEVPDPTSESTFLHSRLNHSLREKGDHRKLLQFYRRALALRKSLPCFAEAERDDIEISAFQDSEAIVVHFRGEPSVLAIFGFARNRARVPIALNEPEVLLNSADAEWGGPGTSIAFNQGLEILPRSVLLLRCSRLSVK